MTARILLTAFLLCFMTAPGAKAQRVQKIQDNVIDHPGDVIPPYGPDLKTYRPDNRRQSKETRSFAVIDGCDFQALIEGRPDLEACRKFCPQICGPAYTNAEVRKFTQTKRRGIVCLSAYEMPELEYAKCQERHGGPSSWGQWCITYNKDLYGMDLQRDWQCAGLIKKNSPQAKKIPPPVRY